MELRGDGPGGSDRLDQGGRSAGCPCGRQEFATEADVPIPAVIHQIRMEFGYDGGGLAKGGDVTIYCDGAADRVRGQGGASVRCARDARPCRRSLTNPGSSCNAMCGHSE